MVVDLFLKDDDVCLLQPTSPTRSDALVLRLLAHGGQVRSVTDGQPNGQCYVYRRGATGWVDMETERGHDIDTLEDFEWAERDFSRRCLLEGAYYRPERPAMEVTSHG